MTGPQLLLLDNDERIVELLSWFLADRGYGVRTARSFAEARAAIEVARPDLLVKCLASRGAVFLGPQRIDEMNTLEGATCKRKVIAILSVAD